MKPKIKALLKQIETGQITTDAGRILAHIKKYPYSTLPEIKRKLQLSHQTASARLSDLQDLGIVEENGTTKTGSYTYFKYQADFLKQEENARERKREKYTLWLKKGLNKFEEFINPNLKRELHENDHKLSA